MDHVFANECFLNNTGNRKSSILAENNNIVNIRTIADKFIFFQTEASKSFDTVNIKFLSGGGNSGSFDTFKIPQLRFTFAALGIFFSYSFIKSNNVIRQVFEIMLYLHQFFVEVAGMFVSLISIEFRNTLNADFSQTENIFLSNDTIKLRFIRFKTFINCLNYSFPRFTFFDIAIYPVLDKYPFE